MNRTIRWLALLAFAFALSACAGSRSVQAPRYYLLSTATQLAPLTTTSKLSIAVGPVEVAEYLDQALLVRRVSNNELQLLEGERWAAPLVRLIPNVLRHDLEQLLPGARTSNFPSALAVAWDYRVALEIERLDGAPGGTVELRASWRIFTAQGVPLDIADGQVHLETRTTAAGAAGLVDSETLLLGQLAVAIANALPH